MTSTFTRVNAVSVDPNFAQHVDALLDPAFVAGTYNANLATPLNTTVTYGQLFRGMPIWISRLTNSIVPPSASIGTSSTTGSTTAWGGVLLDDVTAYTVGKSKKVAIGKKGRYRSYAGGSMIAGDPIKVDISSNFSGFVKWIDGTDDGLLKVGYAFPLDDGSISGTPVVTMSQGDTIFVDL